MRVTTGSLTLDNALGGGLPQGLAILVEGEEGAGSTEFALTALRCIARDGLGRRGTILTALRSADRVRCEAARLFGDEKAASLVDVESVRAADASAATAKAVASLTEGDVLVLESAAALSRSRSERDLVEFARLLGDAANESNATVILLHAVGTLPPVARASLADAMDGVLTFGWVDGGSVRRRVLRVTRIRGLVPVLDADQVPVFEVALQRSTGYAVSRVKSVA